MATTTQNFIDEAVIREDHKCTEPHAPEYEHYKNVKKGLERKDRRSLTGSNPFPKKGGKGGKFTWEGPEDEFEYAEEASGAVDDKDPNYVDPVVEEEDRQVAAGVVEVPKLAPQGVAVLEVRAPGEEEKSKADV